MSETKMCPKCERLLPLTRFSVNKSNRDGKYTYCKTCKAQIAKQTREKDLNESRASEQAYYLQNREIKCRQRRALRKADPLRFLITGARHRAKRKGVGFSLTTEMFSDRFDRGVCEVSGVRLTGDANDYGGSRMYAPSLDRKKAKGDYDEANTRLVALGINVAFQEWGEDATRELMIAWLRHDGYIVIPPVASTDPLTS